jgi:hypothetical protein
MPSDRDLERAGLVGELDLAEDQDADATAFDGHGTIPRSDPLFHRPLVPEVARISRLGGLDVQDVGLLVCDGSQPRPVHGSLLREALL